MPAKLILITWICQHCQEQIEQPRIAKEVHHVCRVKHDVVELTKVQDVC